MSSTSLYIFIFLICIQLIIADRTPNKLEFLFSQIYEPYQYHLESANSLKNELIGTFQNLLFPNISTIYDEAFDQIDITPSFPKSYHNNIPPQQNPLFDQPLKQDRELDLPGPVQASQTSKYQAERMLLKSAFEGYCFNSGFRVQAFVDLFFCNDLQVTKEEYDLQQLGGSCSIQRTETSVCYCAQDFYGDLCENFNPVKCEVENVSHPPEKCTGMEGSQGIKGSKYYSYSLEGEKPCYAVKRDSILKMDFKMKCNYVRPEFGYEGIKINDGYEYQLIDDVSNHTFRYNAEEPGLKMTYFYPFVVKLRFMNWKRLSKPYQIEYVVDGTHVSGAQNVPFSLGITPEMVENCSIGGRYYYDLVDTWNTWITKRVSGVLEDGDFVEPVKIHFKDRYKIWKYVGIGAVVMLVVAAVMICKYVGRNKEEVISKLTLKSVYFQLADENEISVGNISTDVHFQ